jgi:ABC-type lipoprotein release transport system permease subunit
VTVLSLAFGVLASLYPAWRAVQIKPLEALRR